MINGKTSTILTRPFSIAMSVTTRGYICDTIVNSIYIYIHYLCVCMYFRFTDGRHRDDRSKHVEPPERLRKISDDLQNQSVMCCFSLIRFIWCLSTGLGQLLCFNRSDILHCITLTFACICPFHYMTFQYISSMLHCINNTWASH